MLELNAITDAVPMTEHLVLDHGVRVSDVRDGENVFEKHDRLHGDGPGLLPVDHTHSVPETPHDHPVLSALNSNHMKEVVFFGTHLMAVHGVDPTDMPQPSDPTDVSVEAYEKAIADVKKLHRDLHAQGDQGHTHDDLDMREELEAFEFDENAYRMKVVESIVQNTIEGILGSGAPTIKVGTTDDLLNMLRGMDGQDRDTHVVPDEGDDDQLAEFAAMSDDQRPEWFSDQEHDKWKILHASLHTDRLSFMQGMIGGRSVVVVCSTASSATTADPERVGVYPLAVLVNDYMFDKIELPDGFERAQRDETGVHIIDQDGVKGEKIG